MTVLSIPYETERPLCFSASETFQNVQITSIAVQNDLISSTLFIFINCKIVRVKVSLCQIFVFLSNSRSSPILNEDKKKLVELISFSCCSIEE